MASRKRTEITVETHEVLIIRKGDSSVRAWCTDCNAEVRMIPLDEAVGLAGVSITGLLQMSTAGEIHWLQAGTCTTAHLPNIPGRETHCQRARAAMSI